MLIPAAAEAVLARHQGDAEEGEPEDKPHLAANPEDYPGSGL